MCCDGRDFRQEDANFFALAGAWPVWATDNICRMKHENLKQCSPFLNNNSSLCEEKLQNITFIFTAAPSSLDAEESEMISHERKQGSSILFEVEKAGQQRWKFAWKRSRSDDILDTVEGYTLAGCHARTLLPETWYAQSLAPRCSTVVSPLPTCTVKVCARCVDSPFWYWNKGETP